MEEFYTTVEVTIKMPESIWIAIQNGEYCGIIDDRLYTAIKNGKKKENDTMRNKEIEVIHGCYDCKHHEKCPYHDTCTGWDTDKSKWEPKNLEVSTITMTNSAADTIADAIRVVQDLFNAIPAEAEADLYLFSETITNLSIIKNHIEDDEGYEKVYISRPYKRESEV